MNDAPPPFPCFHPPGGLSRRGIIRVAGLQASGVEGDVAANLATLEAMMREAAGQGSPALTPMGL